MEMDLLSFRSLYDSCERLEAARQVDDVWRGFVAAQGTGKDVQTWQKDRWGHVLEPAGNGLSDFLAKHGKGI